MKVLLESKGEGYITARFVAQTPVEAMMLSTCALTETSASLDLKSDTTITDYSKRSFPTKQVTHLTFGGFVVEVHSMLS